MITLLVSAALGLTIGLVLGALGGGGGVLAVPVLVYALGESAQGATTASLIIVGAAAAVGALARRGTGLVQWRTGLVFGALGIPAAYLGTAVNRLLDPPVLLLAFAGLMLAVAVTMLAGTRRRRASTPDGGSAAAPLAAGPPAGGGGVATLAAPRVPTRAARVRAAGKILAAGLGVGFLTGLLGVGGGFLIVPALVIALRMTMPAAIGTSLLVITVNSVASLGARIGDLHVDWTVVVPFTVAAVLATVAGKRVADRFSGDTLTRAFAVLLAAVAVFVTVQSLSALV